MVHSNPTYYRKFLKRNYGTKAASNATAKANVSTKDREKYIENSIADSIGTVIQYRQLLMPLSQYEKTQKD